VAFCAVNESDQNIAVLKHLSRLLPAWPRPVLNDPGKITRLSRDGVASLFEDASHVCAPRVRRLGQPELNRLAWGDISLKALLPGASFPVLVRPVGSHGGKNLERLDGPDALLNYLKEQDTDKDEFFLAEFVDYRGSDGLFRKYRVALIEGVPFLCHMAACDQWKIHYVNAGMAESAAKRADEARAMENFDRDFARRHRTAFAQLTERIGLDYFGIDCGELPDGRLLLFEAETAMIVHNMDSPTLYPYKQAQMAKVFRAFGEMVHHACSRPGGTGRQLATRQAASFAD
jgi:hypothetical protein